MRVLVAAAIALCACGSSARDDGGTHAHRDGGGAREDAGASRVHLPPPEHGSGGRVSLEHDAGSDGGATAELGPGSILLLLTKVPI